MAVATGVLASALTVYTLKASCVATAGQAVGGLAALFIGNKTGEAVVRMARPQRTAFAFPDAQCEPVFETEVEMPDGTKVQFDAPKPLKVGSTVKASFNKDNQEISIEL